MIEVFVVVFSLALILGLLVPVMVIHAVMREALAAVHAWHIFASSNVFSFSGLSGELDGAFVLFGLHS